MLDGKSIVRVLSFAAAGILLCSALAPATRAQTTNAEDLLEPELAFRFLVRATESSAIEVEYEIAEGYYLYREKFKFSVEPASAKLGPAQFPAGEFRTDRFLGRSETYRNRVRIRLPIISSGEQIKLVVSSQGCADVGVCYPPEDRDAVVQLAALDPALADTQLTTASVSAPASSPARPASEEQHFNNIVKSGSVWATILAFFGAGLLLAFTPCVLPMVPILSGIIVGEGSNVTRGRAMALSLAYVLGMAVTYTAIGIAAALSGTLLSVALQSPWVLGAFSMALVIAALSMFGFYDIRLPQFLLSRLDTAQRGLRGGQIASVSLMGMLSAAIVSPCVAAPLAGALLYISQTGDSVLGGVALFSMAAGFGVPLLLVGVFGAALLPRAGRWMIAVKCFFGVLLLALAIWLIAPVIPVATQMLLWAALLIGSAVFLRAVDPLPPDAPAFARLGKAVGILALIGGIAQGYGALSGATDPLQPIGAAKLTPDAAAPAMRFEALKTLAELDGRLAGTRKPVMLDFSADWCVTCKEMERFTFGDPRVQDRLSGLLLLRADVTANTPEHKALLTRFRLFGPPGIVFFDGAGREIKDLRVIGYQSPEKFLSTLDLVARKGI